MTIIKKYWVRLLLWSMTRNSRGRAEDGFFLQAKEAIIQNLLTERLLKLFLIEHQMCCKR